MNKYSGIRVTVRHIVLRALSERRYDDVKKYLLGLFEFYQVDIVFEVSSAGESVLELLKEYNQKGIIQSIFNYNNIDFIKCCKRDGIDYKSLLKSL